MPNINDYVEYYHKPLLSLYAGIIIDNYRALYFSMFFSFSCVCYDMC